MTRRRPVVAILPSRDEQATIGEVTRAVDLALDDPRALIINADASAGPHTAAAFRAVSTRAHSLCLPGLRRGKGAQIRHALRRVGPGRLDRYGTVLLADTDTRNPEPATYRALIETAQAGAAIALADYRRFWDEANLTNHLARPLIAAATGHDVPQPLAGDVALPAASIAAATARAARLPGEVVAGVDGYGIDAFLLQAAAATGRPVVSVRLETTKQHAPSFPHLPAIFAEAVPVLLYPARRRPQPPAAVSEIRLEFRLADRDLDATHRDGMLARLRTLNPHPHAGRASWPAALAGAWQAVADGTPSTMATRRLWPAYLDQVHAWLADTSDITTRAAQLRTAALEVLAMLATANANGKESSS